MTLRSHRTHSRLAAAALLALACVLAGCGRKGGLDLPPSAVAAVPQGPGEPASAPPSATGNSAAVAQTNLFEPSSGSQKAPVAPKGQKKRIILDPILD